MQNKNGRLLHGVPVSIKDNFPMAVSRVFVIFVHQYNEILWFTVDHDVKH